MAPAHWAHDAFYAGDNIVASVFGLLAKMAVGAGTFSYILLLLLFVSLAFTRTDKMSAPRFCRQPTYDADCRNDTIAARQRNA
jgi:hypothetical protein